jgi:hypothetical protein
VYLPLSVRQSVFFAGPNIPEDAQTALFMQDVSCAQAFVRQVMLLRPVMDSLQSPVLSIQIRFFGAFNHNAGQIVESEALS